MKIAIPKHASKIIRKLQSNGYEAYVVGGCVRDAILGRDASDWDITTSATPLQVKNLFYRTIDTGLKHGTVTVLMDKESYEITTYRTGERFNEEEPTQITFASTLEEDLQHRDLTINAMAYNDSEGLVDLFGGLDDINRHVIRCVGFPEERFDEDPLRMLRAIRFAGQLNFDIEASTYACIQTKHKQLVNVSAERVRVELMKLLVSSHPEKIRLAYESGLTSVFLPEFDAMMKTPQNNPHHMYNVGEHTIHAVCHIEQTPVLRLAMLLHDVAKPVCKTTDENGIDHFYRHNEVGINMGKNIMRRLKFDNKTIDLVTMLIQYHDIRFDHPFDAGQVHLRRTMSLVHADRFPYLLKVMDADVHAQSDYLKEKKLTILHEVGVESQEILRRGDCLSIRELKINGKQLIDMGITDGKTIGYILNALLDMVLEKPEFNQYLYLKETALRLSQERE